MKVIITLLFIFSNIFASEWELVRGDQQSLSYFLNSYKGRVKLYNCDVYIDHLRDDKNTVWLTIVDRIRGNNVVLSVLLNNREVGGPRNLLLKKTSGKGKFRKTNNLVINFDTKLLLQRLEYRSIMSSPFKILNSIKCEK